MGRLRAIPAGGGVFLLALLLRIAYLIEIKGTPVADLLLIDSETYDRFARMIMAGEFRGEDIYSMNILYPWFLAVFYRLGGGEIALVPMVQAVLSSLSAVMIWWLGTRLFSNRVGLMAGIIAAIYGPFLFYSGAILTPALIDFLVLTMLVALELYRSSPGWKKTLIAGLLLGLASLGRGNAVLLVPFAFLFFRLNQKTLRKALIHGALFAGGAASLLLLVSARNYLVEKRVVPVSANYAAFYIGHNEHANGLYTLPEFIGSASFEGEVGGTKAAVSKIMGRPVTVAESARYLFSEGWRFARQNPLQEIRLAARKFYFFWNRTESPTNLNYYFARDFSWILRLLPLTFGMVAPFALLGMFFARSRWREHSILYLHISVYLATCVLFFVSAEYRIPAVPVLILFASHGAFALFDSIRRLAKSGRLERTLPLSLAALIALGVFCNYRVPLLKAQSLKRVDYLNFGTLYKDSGDYENARRMLERSLAIDPHFGPAYEALADLASRQGNDQESVHYYELSRKYRLPGQYDRGDRPLDPKTETLLQVADLYSAGDFEGALAGFRDLLTEYQGAGDREITRSLQNNIGLCHYKMGDLEEAARVFEAIRVSSPDYVKAIFNLGKVREGEGDREAAALLYRQALTLEPSYANPRKALERIGLKP